VGAALRILGFQVAVHRPNDGFRGRAVQQQDVGAVEMAGELGLHAALSGGRVLTASQRGVPAAAGSEQDFAPRALQRLCGELLPLRRLAAPEPG
jgi:hypothetical protein